SPWSVAPVASDRRCGARRRPAAALAPIRLRHALAGRARASSRRRLVRLPRDHSSGHLRRAHLRDSAARRAWPCFCTGGARAERTLARAAGARRVQGETEMTRVTNVLLLVTGVGAAACASDGSDAERGPIGKADLIGSCADTSCDGAAPSGNCYCDAECATFGDCCSDYV